MSTWSICSLQYYLRSHYMLSCRPSCPKNWPLNSDRSKNYDRPVYLPCRNEKRLSSTELHQSIKRFYQLLAWGTSFLMTVLVAIMEAISPPYTWLKPNLGLHSCWFDGQYAEVIYFYGPIGRFVKAISYKSDLANP